MITTTATTRTMQHIVETIITSHTGIAYHVEHIAEGMPPNHGFVSVYWAGLRKKTVFKKNKTTHLFSGGLKKPFVFFTTKQDFVTFF